MDNRTRTLLLACSAVDALMVYRIGDGRGQGGSKHLAANPDLWPKGSYREFWRAYELLPKYHRRQFTSFFVANPRFQRWAITKRQADSWKEKLALQALNFVVASLEKFCKRGIFVPQEVTTNAGFLESEAKLIARR